MNSHHGCDWPPCGVTAPLSGYPQIPPSHVRQSAPSSMRYYDRGLPMVVRFCDAFIVAAFCPAVDNGTREHDPGSTRCYIDVHGCLLRICLHNAHPSVTDEFGVHCYDTHVPQDRVLCGTLVPTLRVVVLMTETSCLPCVHHPLFFADRTSHHRRLLSIRSPFSSPARSTPRMCLPYHPAPFCLVFALFITPAFLLPHRSSLLCSYPTTCRVIPPLSFSSLVITFT